MKRFENKIVLVTGGANGLGENLVRRLVDEGAQVAVADIQEEKARALCAEMPDATFFVHCDVSSKASVDTMVAAVLEHFGRVDILFNNAGIGRFKGFLDLTEEDWKQVIGINLTGSFFVGQAVAREMVRLGTKGVIVNTASNTAFRTTLFCTAYASSKGGIAQLTRSMALELCPHGIRVNAVAPGSTMTSLTEATRNNTEKYKKMIGKYSVGRFAVPEEITAVMLFLASDDASYMHGETYLVDSGYNTN